MNFLKKKLKPLTSGFNQTPTASNTNQREHSNKNLEDDLYDEYVVEAPPHPSELLALGVDPSEIDTNDPDKLRELYRKAKKEGKDKKTNSVLLAKQRQKEEIEEKKRTREEWKFFDSLTTRVEQVVKESQKNLDHWKESSAVKELTEPEYEIRRTPDEVFRPVTAAKLEKGANEWINFEDDDNNRGDQKKKSANEDQRDKRNSIGEQLVDEFGCPDRRVSSAAASNDETQNIVVKEILEDFGIDLRSTELRNKAQEKKHPDAENNEETQRRYQQQPASGSQASGADNKPDSLPTSCVARPRPRPKGAKGEETGKGGGELANNQEPDPFDTSFVASVAPEVEKDLASVGEAITCSGEEGLKAADHKKFVDPFDTSYVNF